MILIADSGSTKCDWVVVSDKNILSRVSTIGINPTFHTTEQVTAEVQKTELTKYAETISEIWFYGTGCSSPERNAIIHNGLAVVFPDALIHVNHDLMGAAIATCGKNKGIACILGTGSNACYYNGSSIEDNKAVFGIGYILGDEGSGAHLGKILMQRWLYNQLPETISAALIKRYDLTKAILFNHVYKQAGANTYLASFTPFIHDNIHEPTVRQIVKDGFKNFIDTHLPQFPDHKEVPVHFVGSVAYYFSDLLAEIIGDEGYIMGQIIKQPIDNLVVFHTT